MEKRFLYAVTLVVLIMAIGCEATKEEIGKWTGGSLGGAAGYGASRILGADKTGQTLATIAGVAVGAWLGGKIGQELDERDREAAQKATIRALDSKVPEQQTSTPGMQPVSTARKTTWKSDHNNDISGNSQVVAAGRNTQGQQCKQVREVAYIRGKEVYQETVFCRDAEGGPWVAQA